MERLSLWTMGVVALGCGVAVAVAADGWTPSRDALPAEKSAAPAAPTAASASAGPELFPATQDASQHTAEQPLSPSTAYRPPDLPAGIPEALVPPQSIPQVLILDAPGLARPSVRSRPSTSAEHAPVQEPVAADKMAVKASEPELIAAPTPCIPEPTTSQPCPATAARPSAAVPAKLPAALLHAPRHEAKPEELVGPPVPPQSAADTALTPPAGKSPSAKQVKKTPNHDMKLPLPSSTSPANAPAAAAQPVPCVQLVQQTLPPALPTSAPVESVWSQVQRMPAKQSLDLLPPPTSSATSSPAPASQPSAPPAATTATSPLGTVQALPEKLQVTPAHLAATSPASASAGPKLDVAPPHLPASPTAPATTETKHDSAPAVHAPSLVQSSTTAGPTLPMIVETKTDSAPARLPAAIQAPTPAAPTAPTRTETKHESAPACLPATVQPSTPARPTVPTTETKHESAPACLPTAVQPSTPARPTVPTTETKHESAPACLPAAVQPSTPARPTTTSETKHDASPVHRRLDGSPTGPATAETNHDSTPTRPAATKVSTTQAPVAPSQPASLPTKPDTSAAHAVSTAQAPATARQPAPSTTQTKPDAGAAHPPAVLPASVAQPSPAGAPGTVVTAGTKPDAAAAHLPAAVPTSASIQPATIPIRTTCPAQPPCCLQRDPCFVGPMPPACTCAAVVAAAPTDAAAKNTAAGATKGVPADDSWHIGEWCQDIWGEFSNWATREPVVTANLGMDILKPYWKSNPAFAVVTSPTTARITDFDYGMQVVPQFTLGMLTQEDFGFRFGWWGFASQNSEATLAPGGAVTAAPLGLALPAASGQAIVADSKLRFDVWDFEAFELFHPCHWSLLLSGGIRYAHLSQDYAAIVGGGAGGALTALTSGHDFSGAGPTVSLCGKRPLGAANLYVYGNLRGSILFGNGRQTAADSVGVGNITQTTDDVMPEAELEIGLGWYRALGQAQFFAQMGLVSQVWIDAGNSSRSEISPISAGSQTDATLGLLGLSMRVGINY